MAHALGDVVIITKINEFFGILGGFSRIIEAFIGRLLKKVGKKVVYSDDYTPWCRFPEAIGESGAANAVLFPDVKFFF